MADFENWPPRKRYYYEIYKDGDHIGNALTLRTAKENVDSGYWETYWDNTLFIKGSDAMKSDKVKKYYINSTNRLLQSKPYGSLEEAFDGLKEMVAKDEASAIDTMDRLDMTSLLFGAYFIEVRYE
jgi:hypothetical protein